jgi:hypothetical protein
MTGRDQMGEETIEEGKEADRIVDAMKKDLPVEC